MATPTITIEGAAKDLFGEAQAGQFVVQLAGYGSQVPRVVGTALLAQTAPLPFYLNASAVPGNYNFKLWGNDVITPANTFYTIRVVDVNGNTVQINAYQFSGTQTVDLANAPPYNPVPSPIVNALVYAVCTGAFPGTQYQAPGRVIMVVYNGVAQRPTTDPADPQNYSVDAANLITLTFETYDGDTVYALCVE